MAAKKEEGIQLQEIKVKHAKITIEGDGDLVLNKMNDVVALDLINARKDKAKRTEKSNMWEEIITSMHWRDGKPTDFSEESLVDALTNNAPCITSFGLLKSFCDSVVRNGIDKYSTKFKAGVNVIAKGGLIPIAFAEHRIDEKLMSPKKEVQSVIKYRSRYCADMPTGVGTHYSIRQINTI